ncbi:hypothetical protein CTZ27_29880 [Streptomyces griseocarneus]|nr:hypothetical protein CTZ27_29880 [Streptomyces griseocarneus]
MGGKRFLVRVDDSVPPAHEQLAAHLRTLGSGGLASLLSERPDAVSEPRPHTLVEVAQRLLRPGSVRRVAARLTLPCLEAAEALAAMSVPAPQALLRSLLVVPSAATAGGDGNAVEHAAERLLALGLVWPAGPEREAGERDLVMADALRGLWDHPLDLYHPVTGVEALTAHAHTELLTGVLAALGIPAKDGVAEQRAALVAHHRDSERVRELVAQAPDASQRLLKHLARLNTTTFSAGHDSELGRDWAAERGLLACRTSLLSPGRSFFFGGDAMQLPAEILMALRGPGPAAPFHPRPPQIATVAVTDLDVAEAAASAAAVFLSQAGTVMEACAVQPPKLLKDGGIGTRELIRLTKVSGCAPTTVRLILECAHAAGLLAYEGDERVVPTLAYAAWTSREPAQQYTELALAWRQMLSTPTRAHYRAAFYSEDRAEDRPLPALESRAACEGCRDARAALLEAAATLGPQQAVDISEDPYAGFRELISWHRPRVLQCACPDEEPPFEDIVREAVLLGILARGALSPLAAPLLPDAAEATLQESELSSAAQALLPPLADVVCFGGDLTATAPGVPSPRLVAVLDQVADRELRHPARVWRITSASLRRALDAGKTAEEITHGLRAASDADELPQCVTDLVEEAARAHGGIRLTAPSCVLHSADTALVAELAAHPGLAAVRLRLLAPTVLTSPAAVEDVLAALRDAGYAPVQEEDGGTVRIERPALPGPLLPVPPAPPGASGIPDYPRLAETLLSGQPARAGRSGTEQVLATAAQHLDTATLRRLAHAIDHHLGVAITYSAVKGRAAEHALHGLELDPPYLHACIGPDDELQSFHLGRIRDVDDAPWPSPR